MHYELFLLDELRFEKMKCTEAIKVRLEQWCLQRMGNVLVKALEAQLYGSQLYPGDTSGPHGHLRFTVWESKKDHILKFIDHDCGLGGELPISWVLDSQFSPGEFWGRQLAMFDNIPAFQNMDYPRMGHLLATAAQESLTKHVPFIKDSKNLEDDVHYIIYLTQESPRIIPIKYLINLNFDLPNWYRKKLNQAYETLLQWLQGPVEYEFLTQLFSQSMEMTPFEKELDSVVAAADSYLHLMNGNLHWEERNGYAHVMSIAGVQIEPKTYPAIQ
ncbi:hypothetical protein ARMSODRAFT_1017809 [Armillaria solidipes]|uniref:Uncharacterized protein n=1 Tax=Armillaria solidipes TaxID=1076256 RepID=A0A2H3BVM5_9AGAR|nr:hypothetical protein ARMSODRAFT_1017809 [Armillaria solidipes]